MSTPLNCGGSSEIWTARAEALLLVAAGQVRDGVHDAIATVDAALMALKIEAGEAPADAMDGYPFPDEEEEMT